MRAILDVAVPFFALIFLGFAALRWRILDRAAVAGLNAFVYWFALPVLLFAKVAGTPTRELLAPDFFVAYYGASFSVYALGFLVGRLVFGAGVGQAALMGLGASFGNVGYMGIPLLITGFGRDQALPAVLAVTFDNLTTVFLTIVLLEVGAKGGGGGRAAFVGVARGLAFNPLILAVLLGAFAAALPFGLPGTVEAFAGLLGAAAAPCALFALGASLVGTRLGGAGRELLSLALMKLVLHPLLVAGIASWLWPMPRATSAPILVLAALPTAATVFVVAGRYGVYAEGASGLVLLTHVLSVVTLTALLVWAAPG
ncbi:MAG: AEC family transporter [Geminicoccaceae bacterium]|nr:AEC family transporter [Geminicoccaceae bacterium]